MKSRGLEALEKLHTKINILDTEQDLYNYCLITIEKELKEKEVKAIEVCKEFFDKELKALEIIKEKKVNVGDFVRCKSIEDYNEYCCYGKEETLTQEEYDLLKEVLEWQ